MLTGRPHLGPVPRELQEPDAADARRWRRLGAQATWLPWVLDLIWVGIVALLVSQTWTEPVCSEANSCEQADWAGAVFFSVLGVQFWWFHRHPHLAPLSACVLTVMELTLDPDLPGYRDWVVPTFLGGVFATAALLVWQHARRREQRELMGRSAVTVAGIDVEVSWWLPSLRVIAAAVCAGGTLLASGWASWHQANDNDHLSRATVVPGLVVGTTDDARLRVELDGSQVLLDTADTTGYPVGSVVTVLRDGEWSRLRAEPYDPTFAGAWAIVLGLVAATRLLEELRIRRAVARLRRPHRALRIRARWVDADRVVLDPEGTGSAPVVTLAVLPVASTAPEDDDQVTEDESGAQSQDEGWLDEWSATTVEELREASRQACRFESVALHGDVALGAHPCLVGTTDDGHDLIAFAPDGPVRSAWRLRDDPALVARQVLTSVEAGASDLTEPPTRALVFGGGRIARAAGAVLLTATPAATVLLVRAAQASWVEVVLLAGGGLVLVNAALRIITDRVVLGAEGIAMRSAGRSRTVPWEDVDHCEPGEPAVLITRDPGHAAYQVHELSWGLPAPVHWLRRRISSAGTEVVDTVNAMALDRSLRPLAPTMPLGDVPLALRLGLAGSYLVVVGVSQALV
ncbi:MAG: hypothetical protein JNL54_15505 [Kineosporiaceae bacterium]|nr:hypothetical protein [Kineosporiaceae bacterium]